MPHEWRGLSVLFVCNWCNWCSRTAWSADGCDADLEEDGKHCLKRRLCKQHMASAWVVRRGQQMRFCQQCGKLQLLSCFDGDRRSCREQLAQRRQGGSSSSSATKRSAPQQEEANSDDDDIRDLEQQREQLELAQQYQQQQFQQQQQQQRFPCLLSIAADDGSPAVAATPNLAAVAGGRGVGSTTRPSLDEVQLLLAHESLVAQHKADMAALEQRFQQQPLLLLELFEAAAAAKRQRRGAAAQPQLPLPAVQLTAATLGLAPHLTPRAAPQAAVARSGSSGAATEQQSAAAAAAAAAVAAAATAAAAAAVEQLMTSQLFVFGADQQQRGAETGYGLLAAAGSGDVGQKAAAPADLHRGLGAASSSAPAAAGPALGGSAAGRSSSAVQHWQQQALMPPLQSAAAAAVAAAAAGAQPAQQLLPVGGPGFAMPLPPDMWAALAAPGEQPAAIAAAGNGGGGGGAPLAAAPVGFGENGGELDDGNVGDGLASMQLGTLDSFMSVLRDLPGSSGASGVELAQRLDTFDNLSEMLNAALADHPALLAQHQQQQPLSEAGPAAAGGAPASRFKLELEAAWEPAPSSSSRGQASRGAAHPAAAAAVPAAGRAGRRRISADAVRFAAIPEPAEPFEPSGLHWRL